ncbi:FAD-binding and (Fe-S)-binding domain-containing protein [Ornithinicoccus hortensis]|uniref:D-lactate dehydrogenase (cytochrome) n=1 Tax=Ornithinicoccus hortensis TaxID=82346 RepID=A0A542YTM2_9MICO|nr:FAD-binding and (Fe-S)-binding domain-containing protein [Ornithinicoccus hortensis]TQL51442.1 D-lactate dehydrogenase [Ornithinicoccus hortensis]
MSPLPTQTSPWEDLADTLSRALGPAAVSRRALDRHAMAHDASHYLLTPELLVRPTDREQVAAVLRACDAAGTPVTFRSGGTSLSGQGITDAVLVDTRRHFRGVEVLDGGARVRVQPGTTVRQVNARLAPYRTKLGPDPASEGACTIGGVVANNSSGMHCGTEFNTYATLDSLVLVLPTGTLLDTAAPDAAERLRTLEPDLYAGLLRLRERVASDPASVATIRRLFAMKNTMGYGLNSLLDFTDPLDILVHLMIGSEGTLGFVAEATFRTVPVDPAIATGLLVFPDVTTATGSVPDLVGTGAATAELLDAASLRVSQRDPQCPPQIRDLQITDHAALLIEYTGGTAEELSERVAAATPALRSLPVTAPAELSEDGATRTALWRVRKGLFSAVAGARPQGTNALLEDVVVEVGLLGQTCASLTELFDRHSYEESVIFGHAKDGNVHFMLNERFDDDAAMARYAAFTEDMVDLVLGNGGSLKAEHGTGRIMAPFVRRQYGDELYAVMWELKRLIDPRGLLNPGAVLSDDPDSYLRDLKPNPRVEEEVDRCVECGYCEPVCPSRDVTLTPRQRIVLRREMVTARERGDHALARELEQDYVYEGEQTCAVDGMCLTACPVLIDTGDLVRRLRRETVSPVADRVWEGAAHAWGATAPGAALALSAARALPAALPVGVTAAARAVLGHDTVPLYDDGLPAGGSPRPRLDQPGAEAVLFSACIGQMFGPETTADGAPTPGAAEALRTLCERAGVRLRTPADPGALCCGTPWKSKGLGRGYAVMADRVVPALREATGGGAIPVVIEASSCAEGLVEMLRDRAPELRVLDAVEFVAEQVLPRLTITRRVDSVVVHPTCSTERAGTTRHLLELARAVGEEVSVPTGWGCCGFAGDRGLLHPELTASATAPEAAEVRGTGHTAYVSSNRTCEIGMTRATGRPYRHVLELLLHATG